MHGAESGASPRADRRGGLAWMALGLAVLLGSVTMDRLAEQGVAPYAAPGLMPGLLGLLMIVTGGLLALRAWRQEDGPAIAVPGGTARLILVLALCLIFDIVLVGHGLPFWAASALFVTGSILALQHGERVAAGQRLTVRAVAVAAAIGLAAGWAVTIVFERIFLVHLP